MTNEIVEQTEIKLPAKPPRGRVFLVNKKQLPENLPPGFYLPRGAEDQHILRGEVIACGLPALTKKGAVIDMEVGRGDEVLYHSAKGTDLVLGAKVVRSIMEADLIAVVEGTPCRA